MRKYVDPTSINRDMPLPLTREEKRFINLIGVAIVSVLIIAGLIIYWIW